MLTTVMDMLRDVGRKFDETLYQKLLEMAAAARAGMWIRPCGTGPLALLYSTRISKVLRINSRAVISRWILLGSGLLEENGLKGVGRSTCFSVKLKIGPFVCLLIDRSLAIHKVCDSTTIDGSTFKAYRGREPINDTSWHPCKSLNYSQKRISRSRCGRRSDSHFRGSLSRISAKPPGCVSS